MDVLDQKQRKFIELLSEWTFGLTGLPFTFAGQQFDINMHELNHHALGMAGDVKLFRVRNVNHQIITLDKTAMVGFMATAYEVISQRDVEWAGKLSALATTPDDKVAVFNTKSNWSKRGKYLDSADRLVANRKNEPPQKPEPIIKEQK
jgi:hypothetical protein